MNVLKEQETSGKNRKVIEMAVAAAGQHKNIAAEMGTSAGNLSKMISGNINTFCRLLDVLGLEINSVKTLESLEHLLREKL